MSDEQTRETTDILNRQNLAFVKGDVDEIMKDFSEKSMLFTPNGVLEGIDSIRKFYTDTITSFLPPGLKFDISKQEVRGQTAYIVWSAESKNYRFSLGTDTFFIKDGKILVQTFAAKTESKNT